MISLNWVKDYIDLEGVDLNDLAVSITKAGINVERVVNNNIKNLIVGKVISCSKHPDSDHLNICKVDVGHEILQIVCGASNVKENIKVIVAKIGAVLPGGFEIKAGKIRGIESNGMICALFELGIEQKTEENYNKGIEILSEDFRVGDDPTNYFGLDDTLYELDIHKHRNNDCYYHIGFAYEIAAILSKKVNLPDMDINSINENTNSLVDVIVETDKCPLYLTKIVKNVEIKESPNFIKKRLIAAGMRPINNVVDISNYVMLEYGQPLHFFDYDKLGNKVVVRNALENEKIITIDGKERNLISSDIIITDGNKPVCIAGVMGGKNTDVDSNTKTILIESAIFDATSIRYTSSRLNLKSEASIRYGKGLNYEYTENAILRACHLLQKYASAQILTGVVRKDKIDKTPKIVKFKTDELNSMLGITISSDDIEIELNRLDFPYEKDNNSFTLTIPNRRLDIDPNINDIAEEIGRLYGYHNLVSTLPKCTTKQGQYIKDVKLRKDVSKRLRSLGFNECKTYTLTSPEMVKLFRYEEKENIVLPNPMSIDKSIIRTSILPSLLNVYDYNKSHKVDDILIYEISKTYDINNEEDVKLGILAKGSYINNNWNNNDIKIDFYVLKGVLENILDYLGFKNRYLLQKDNISSFHSGISARIMLDKESIGVIGRIHPNIRKDDIYLIELSLTKIYSKTIKPLKYKQSLKYPSIVKDVAFVVKKDIQNEEIVNAIKKSGGRLLTNVAVFDVYKGSKIKDDEVSIAYNLKFEDHNRTLTEEEVMVIFNKIIIDVETKLNAKVRNGE